jgi:hypothetical protein
VFVESFLKLQSIQFDAPLLKESPGQGIKQAKTNMLGYTHTVKVWQVASRIPSIEMSRFGRTKRPLKNVFNSFQIYQLGQCNKPCNESKHEQGTPEACVPNAGGGRT